MPNTQEEIRDIKHKLGGVEGRVNAVGGATAHNLLSATHPDTDPATPPARGSIIRGTVGNEWEEYPLGAAARYLRSDGNDALWTALQAGDMPAHAAKHIGGGGDPVDHDLLQSYVANEHIDHTAVTLTAGVGLTGGGTIAANRTFNVDVGIGDDKIVQIDAVDVAANDYAKFTAVGVLGRSYDEVLSDLSGEALAAFNWNAQSLTNAGITFIGDTVNTFMTLGLTINQGGADNEILALKSSDVAVGVTDRTETDTYGYMKKLHATDGGLNIFGLSSDVIGFNQIGVATNDNTTKGAGAKAPLLLKARKKVGTNWGACGANANLVVIANHSDEVWGVDAEGDPWQLGTKFYMPNMQSGANQGAAGAAAGELWHDTTDDTVKMGV